MQRIAPATLLAIGFCLALAGCGGPSGPEAQAEAAVLKLGGNVRHDGGHVVKVDLSTSRATDGDLAILTGLTHLDRLYLPSRITDMGLVHLAGMTNLTKLDLQNTQVTDAGLTQLKALPALNKLYVHGSKATEQGMVALEKDRPGLTVERFPISRD